MARHDTPSIEGLRISGRDTGNFAMEGPHELVDDALHPRHLVRPAHLEREAEEGGGDQGLLHSCAGH